MLHQHISLGTILIVDDHLPLLRNLAFLLEVTGFQVLTASNGSEALESLESLEYFTPDVVIADIEMPVMDGYAFVSALRQSAKWYDLPVIFMSAHYELEDLLYGLEMGANDYVPKPFDIFDILDAIHRTAPHIISTQPQQLAG